MVLDDALLDDPARLAEADTTGLLRAAAMAGAQVRSTTELAADIELADRLDVGRPRALVLVVRPGVGRALTKLLAALLAPSCPVPVVISDAVPSWIGALDVVFAHTDDPADRELAAGVERAARFGAGVVVSGPQEGPVAAAIAGKGALLTPRIPVPPELTFSRGLAAGLLTANALGLLVADVEALADQLDAEAERGHLGRDSFANPAKALALRLADRVPMLWGLDPAAVAVAEHAAYELGAYAGMVCDAAHYRQALARPALHRAAVVNSGEQDIFADPDFDDVGPKPRVLLLAVHGGPTADAARYEASHTLPGAGTIAPGDEIPGDEPVRAGVLALRFELAAVYLGLAAGSLGGAGHYAPATA
ncbi:MULTISPECIES: SIS domain-containing protein [Amycolatopsis]|uniref:Phospho-glucose isomerase C-terminal SIS domain-containing protein n=2 Tax=Amycolatopsis TaxID=1813 RepID=A0A1I3ZX06_9PSEU|nr:SIS domain-containing protein [Amycolatopsis sacchari]SFK48674.1 phospho-glucose isomerase C-terminal SIS domain-containing protein [Amycolatopsis sacchari]